jgi:hypothetical protein
VKGRKGQKYKIISSFDETRKVYILGLGCEKNSIDIGKKKV